MGDVTPAIPFPVIERRLAAARQQKEVSGEGDSHQHSSARYLPLLSCASLAYFPGW